MLFTIFTPTYNRAYILSRLYESLKRQKYHDFEWLIIDDGSTDDTEVLVNKLKKEEIINIKYYKQQNKGKHIAINKGASLAEGELFFIVDSDDILTDDALSTVAHEYQNISEDDSFCGVCACRCHSDGSKIGTPLSFDFLDTSALDFRMKYRYNGDMAEVVKTKIIREYPFPHFIGELFCPEALIWYRISGDYKFRFLNKKIYVTEYLSDGLTSKIIRLRHQSPKASMMYYAELFHYKIPLHQRLKAAINYWRFAVKPNIRNHKMLNYLSLISWLPGRLMRLNDERSI